MVLFGVKGQVLQCHVRQLRGDGGAAMTTVTIRFDGADEGYEQTLAEYLKAQAINIEYRGEAVGVEIGSFEQCDHIGRSIADFIREQPRHNHPLRVEGPDGDALLFQLYESDVATTISGLLASCALLQ
jgi:hypothetical protein